MLLKSVKHSHLHDPVYGKLDKHGYIKAKLADPPGFIQDMVGYRNSSPYMTNLGIRAAAIQVRFQEVLDRMIEGEVGAFLLGMEQEGVLERMKICSPGGFMTDQERYYVCDKYTVCPFCRFRKAVRIFNEIQSRMTGKDMLAVIRISRSSSLMGLEGDPEASYRLLIKSICKNRKLFRYDHLITVPNWYQTYEDNLTSYQSDPEYTFSVDTSIIGLVDKDRLPLPLPENCVSPEARTKMGFCGADAWMIMKPTKLSLSRAIGYAMPVSPALLSPNITPIDYFEAITLQQQYRAVSHGT